MVNTKKRSIAVMLVLAMFGVPAQAFGDTPDYLPDSSGIELKWEFTETPPARPYPRLLNSSEYELKWKQDNELMFELIQDRNGILYTTDSENIVQAVFPNGKVKWSMKLDTGSDIGVIYLELGEDGTIYAYSTDNFYLSDSRATTIYAISPEGEVLWKLNSDTIYSQFDYHFAGDSNGNFLYFTEQGLVSRNKSGEINWVNKNLRTGDARDFLSQEHVSKIYADSKGNIYVDTPAKEIVSIDQTGAEKWRSEPQEYLNLFTVFRPYFSEGGILYMLTADGLHALSTEDGSPVEVTRRSDLTDIRSSGIPTDGNGGYYLYIQGTLHKIDYKGNPLWRYTPRETEKYGIGSWDTMATDDAGNVYFPTGVGNMIGLNSDGQEIFAFLRNAFWHKQSEIVIGTNGNVYSTHYDIGFAAFGPKQIQVYMDNLYMPMSVAPINQKGTVFVPFRSLFEGMGLEVNWDQQSKTITGKKDGLEIRLMIGSTAAYVNGATKQLSASPFIRNGNSYVPLRFVGEALGKMVSWDGDRSAVNIDRHE